MRILHLADVHLDTSFAGRSAEVRARLREATRTAFRRGVELAIRERVHVVLLAGDLFDSERLSFETECFLLSELERLAAAAIPVIYCTGNHDPGSGRTARRDLAWPDGVTVVSGPEPLRIPVPDPESLLGEPLGFVTTAGHPSVNETRDLAATFPRPQGDLPEVAMLHTQVVSSRSADAHEAYAPCELETLVEAGYDYWALGHVHLRQELSAHPAVHYPGNVQGRTPRETGAKGCILATVRRGAPAEWSFHPLAPVRWELLEMDDLGRTGSVEGLVEGVAHRWTELRAADPDPGADWMVRVRLSGSTPLADDLAREENLAWLGEELAARLGALEVEVKAGELHPPVEVEAHLDRDDVLGESLRLVRGLLGAVGTPDADSDRSASIPEWAVEGLAGLEGGENPAAYLREILAGGDLELVSRLLQRKGDR